ncbi:MAG: outer membrane beta-barrel protein [Desulfobacterales bacterium]
MKKYFRWCLIFSLVLTFVSIPTINTYAENNEKQNYMTFKAGIYYPESGDYEDFDTGFNGEISIGHYFSPNVALEFGIGYFDLEWSDIGYEWPIGNWSDNGEITTIPLTATLKGIIPFKRGELYGGAGIGVYLVEGEVDVNSDLIDFKVDDDDVTFGPHVLIGLNIDISQNAFIGVEGKYTWAEKAEFEETILGQKVEIVTELDGFIGTFNIGFRF